MSYTTSTWPSQCGPAPIPIVGTGTARVTRRASCDGIFSRTIAKTPASDRIFASRTIWSASAPSCARTS